MLRAIAKKKGEAPVVTEEENPKIDLGEYIREEPPYPEEKVKLIQKFFKQMNKRRDADGFVKGRTTEKDRKYVYTDTGNLEVRTGTDQVESTIILKTFLPHDSQSRDVMEQERLDAIGEAETQYEAALSTLQKATEDYRLTGNVQPVLAAQKGAAAADQILTKVRYGSRDIVNLANPETRMLLFEDKYEVRKVFKNKDVFKKELYRLPVFTIPITKFYGTYVDTPEAVPGKDVDATMNVAGLSDGTVRQKLRDGRWARIFYDVEDGPSGFLSPFWPTDFTVGSVRYMCAFQAFEYKRAEEAGREGMMKNIMGSRSVRTIRFCTSKLETQPKDAKGLWLSIFTAIYQKYPELKERLLQTGTDALVFADIRKGPSGIGFAPKSKECLDPSRWTGENAAGIALETLRYQFREGTAAEAAEDTAPTTSVITEDQQQKAKVGAIIGGRRRFFNKG